MAHEVCGGEKKKKKKKLLVFGCSSSSSMDLFPFLLSLFGRMMVGRTEGKKANPAQPAGCYFLLSKDLLSLSVSLILYLTDFVNLMMLAKELGACMHACGTVCTTRSSIVPSTYIVLEKEEGRHRRGSLKETDNVRTYVPTYNNIDRGGGGGGG